QSGRILLAGDAAHVHSPAGGQGMNTGIQDALALAEALKTALEADGKDALHRYSTERRPIAERVIHLADRLTRLATVKRQLTPVRNLALRTLAHIPGFRHQLAMQLAELRPA